MFLDPSIHQCIIKLASLRQSALWR